jgi:hypothetical protein
VAAGLLAVAFLLGFTALFTSWWTVSSEHTSSSGTVTATEIFHAQPYSSGGISSEFGDILDGQVLTTGILATFAILALGGAIALAIAGYFVPGLPSWLKWVAPAVPIALGLVAVILAPILWPDGFKDGVTEMSDGPPDLSTTWWGTKAIDDNDDIVYSPGLGWFFAIAGFILLPGAALAARAWPDPGAPREPPKAWLPTAPPPPPLPVHEKPADSSAQWQRPQAAAPPRRLSVVKKSVQRKPTEKPTTRKAKKD